MKSYACFGSTTYPIMCYCGLKKEILYPAYHFSSRPNRDFPYDNKCFSNHEFVSVSVFVSVLGWAGTFHMGFGCSISFRMGFGGESILSVMALMWCRLCALLNVGLVMRSSKLPKDPNGEESRSRVTRTALRRAHHHATLLR